MVYGQGAKVSHELQMRQGGKVQVRRPASSALWLILCYLISRILILPQTGCNNTHWGTAILSSSACHYIPLIIIALPVHKIILAAQHLERHSRVNEQAFKVIPLQYAEYVNFSLQNFEKTSRFSLRSMRGETTLCCSFSASQRFHMRMNWCSCSFVN